jgi:hypothetical protein
VWKMEVRYSSRAPTWMVSIPPLPLEPPLDPRAEPFVAVIKAAGAEPMIEWGVLSGEILGLEVAALHDPDGA